MTALLLLSLLLLLSPSTDGTYSPSDLLQQLYGIEGCPKEEAAAGSCAPLQLDSADRRVVCPHRLWRGTSQLIYHVATNTTTVTTKWTTIGSLEREAGQGGPGGPLTKITLMDGKTASTLVIGQKVMCSGARPELSLAAFLPLTWSPIVESMPIYFCPRWGFLGEVKCEHGQCVLGGGPCQCHTGWRGDRCNDPYDPYGVAGSAPTFPPTPAYAVRDTCNILIAEGCPDEEMDDCVKLRLFQDGAVYSVYCPRKMWLTTDAGSWEPINELVCGVKNRWHIKSNGNIVVLDPWRHVQCAHAEPKGSTAVSLRRVTNIKHHWGSIEQDTHLCYRNAIQCQNGGICAHTRPANKREPVATYCVCDSMHSGAHCEHSIPENPGCAPMLAEACPVSDGNCAPLKFHGNSANCDRTLWVSKTQAIYHVRSGTASYTSKWTKIEALGCGNEGWVISWRSGAQWTWNYEKLTLDRKVMCASDTPRQEAVGAFWEQRGFEPTKSNFVYVKPTPLAFCPHEMAMPCGRGVCVMTYAGGTFTKSCQCDAGWRGAICDEAYDPYGVGSSAPTFPPTPTHAVRDTCDILIAEGCPDEATGDCLKLRFYRKNARVHAAYCHRTMWVSAENTWNKIDELICEKTGWKIKVNNVIVGDLDPRRRVQCSHAQPKSATADALRRVTNIRHRWGRIEHDTSLCYRNSAQCQNGGVCAHTQSATKTEPVATFCACPTMHAGARCELTIPESPECSSLLVEGCPSGGDDSCAPLRFHGPNRAANCDATLWVSNVQAVFHNYSRTHSHTTKWTKIEKLECAENGWKISWKAGAKSEWRHEQLGLDRKVICSFVSPWKEAGAFRHHKGFIPTRANFAADVKPTPLAYCPHELHKSCGDGQCVLSYGEDDVYRDFVQSCYCNFGFTGAACDALHDPYGMDWAPDGSMRGVVVGPAAPDAVHETCIIQRAEGCPGRLLGQWETAENRARSTCDPLRYYDSGVLCRKKLWVSTGPTISHTKAYNTFHTTTVQLQWSSQRWERIEALTCTKRGWEIRRGNARERLALEMRVQCASHRPDTRVDQFGWNPREKFEEDGTVEGFCFGNTLLLSRGGATGSCMNGGYCVRPFRPAEGASGGDGSYPYCVCIEDPVSKKGFEGENCARPIDHDNQGQPDLREDQMLERMGPSLFRPHGHRGASRGDSTTTKRIAICDPAALEDGCHDHHCEKLHANTTRVKCAGQLWLNYGGEWWLDWHEISGVHCVDNVWRSECNKKIGKSHLICSSSSSRPSALSSSLWLALVIGTVVTVIVIGATCAACLICRKRRSVQRERVARAAARDARTPHSCASSTQQEKDAEVTDREDTDC